MPLKVFSISKALCKQRSRKQLFMSIISLWYLVLSPCMKESMYGRVLCKTGGYRFLQTVMSTALKVKGIVLKMNTVSLCLIV